MLHTPGEKLEQIYFPISGLVSARALLETGHQMECVAVGRTSAVGAVTAIGCELSLTHNVCMIESHGWTISASDLNAAMRASPLIEQQLKRVSLSQMSYAVLIGICNAMHTAEQRIARWLLIASHMLHTPEIRIAQEELSNVLGLQRSAVNPMLQKLKGERLIELSRGRIAIVDPLALVRRTCECHGQLCQTLQLL